MFRLSVDLGEGEIAACLQSVCSYRAAGESALF